MKRGISLTLALCAEAALSRAEGQVLELALASDGRPPSSILLFPAGKFAARDGRAWINDDPAAVVTAFARNNADLPIDIEHATEKKGPAGEPAPAVGWIKGLAARDDGSIWADVEWTEEGARAIASRSYRYYSPAFLHTKDGRVRSLSSAGLTNKPAIEALPALTRENPTEETMKEFLEKLAEALGLKDPTEESVLAKCRALNTELATARQRGDTPDPAKFVPRADLELALARAKTAEEKIAASEKAAREKEVSDLVDGAVKAGKIAPASKDHYLALCRTAEGVESFKKLVESLPVTLDPAKVPGQPPTVPGKALTREQEDIAKLFGNSKEDLEKYAG